MGRWVKSATVPVARKHKWICPAGEEHYSAEERCRCGNDLPDVQDNAKPGGYITVRHTRRKPPRTAGPTGYAYGYTRAEARKEGMRMPIPKNRKRLPNKPMWQMTAEERRRAASKATI